MKVPMTPEKALRLQRAYARQKRKEINRARYERNYKRGLK